MVLTSKTLEFFQTFEYFLLRLLSENPGCPGGCAYLKEGETDSEVWCFSEGPYNPVYSCPSTTGSTTPGF